MSFRVAYILTAVLAAVTAIAAYLNLADAERFLVVHLDSFRGIDFLGEKKHVWGILGMAAALSLINIWLSRVFYHRIRFFSELFSWFNILLWILMFIVIGVIIAVN